MSSYPIAGLVPNCPQGSKFYNHSQAKILAETYYNMGHDLYITLLPVIKLPDCKAEDMWKLWPACVNLAFSCEILLKLFYENENGKIAHGHKLYNDLFKKLSYDSQKMISDTTISSMKVNGHKNYTYADFKDDLIKSENTFSYERYVFEIIPGKGNHGLRLGFLLSFARVLNILSQHLV